MSITRLSATEARMTAVLNTVVDAIIIIDEKGRIESFNPAAERIFGYSEADVLKKNVNLLMPKTYAQRHDTYLNNYLTTGEAKIIGKGREVVGQRADGSQFPMDLAVSEYRIGRKRYFTGIVRDISQRKQLQQAIVDASEMERKQIGQDLHDTVSQHLAGLTMITRVLQKKIMELDPDQADQLAPDAERVAQLAATALKQVKDISHGLYPVELERNGLSTALEHLANQQDGLFHVHCRFETNIPRIELNAKTAVHLYRIAQEAISNAVKHAAPTEIVVEFKRARSGLRLTVRDDGKGMPKKLKSSTGLGLAIMRYRATMIDAEFRLISAPGRGTKVSCALPGWPDVQDRGTP